MASHKGVNGRGREEGKHGVGEDRGAGVPAREVEGRVVGELGEEVGEDAPPSSSLSPSLSTEGVAVTFEFFPCT